jgi:3-deoxy-D-manno-octulosonic-acid transferase
MPIIVARLWWRGRREPGYREGLRERFGKYPPIGAAKLVWIHAVSVGEARAAAPLVRALQGALPAHAFLLTCTTAAGRETLKEVYGDSVFTAYLPHDYPGAVRRFLRHFRPQLGILMETEVWPNLLAACAEQAVPVVLANARMSEKSALGYQRWASLFAPAFASLTAVCAQSDADGARLRALGARNVQITGNLKFDAEPDPEQIERGRAWRTQLRRPVMLLASTREGEEKLLLEALPQWDGRLLVLVVPRHPRRFDEVAQWAQSRRTEIAMPADDQPIYLGDTMGEMAFYFAACDVAVIGGSFMPLGGQNLIEALACGAPVVLGPSMYNFAEATRLATEAGAAVQVSDAPGAIREALELMNDSPRRESMARAGKALCEMHRGATHRHLQICMKLLKIGV